MTSKARVFWPALLGVLALDVVTKRMAVDRLERGVPEAVLGDVVRFTLSYNQGAAMGISLGDWSRPAFSVLALAATVVLVLLYRATAPNDWLRAAAAALVLGGAVGNLFDRLRWTRGVVDFVDIGVGSVRFWTFNVADMGVTVGVVILMVVLGREEAGRPPPA